MSTKVDSLNGSEIAVVGMAGRFPGAVTLAQFWANLRDGVESVRQFGDAELIAAGEPPEMVADPDYVKARPVLSNVEMFDAGFFGFSPQDAAIMDPQHRVFLEVGWEAVEDTGHDPATFAGTIGVFATCGMNTYMMYHLVTNQRIMQTVGEWLVRHTGNDMNFLATRLSYELGLKGPSMNVQTACSSALVGIHLACQSLLNGECDMALAGGSVIALPQDRGYLYKPGEILSPDGHCRAFDARAQGTLFGSGAGVVALRRLADALADGDQVYAVVKGSAVNNDGAVKVGYLAPSVEGQSRAVIEALAMSGVDAETISYIEAHGTGTLVGDPIEMTALTEAYRQHTDKTGFCAIGSLKTNIGHLGEAAGVAGFIKTALSLRHRQLPPSLHYEAPNPQIDFAASPFSVNAALREWTSPNAPRRAGITSLGAGGTNCHVIVEEAPERDPSGASRSAQLLVISAKTPTALDAAAANLATALEQEPSLNLADAAYTLQVGRKTFSHRRAIVCRSRDEAIEALRSGNGLASGTGEPKAHPVVFMFPGQGSQYARMGLDVYEHEPVFREEIDRCLDTLGSLGLGDLRSLIYPSGQATDQARLNRTAFTQPALFAIEYALAKLWMHWGIQPQAMIGHSIGEYVAACLSGVFSLPDALALVSTRGALMEGLPSGAMLSVPLAAAEIGSLPAGAAVSIAASNAPALSVVSGPDDAIAALEADLVRRGVESQRLRTSHAFHSAMMDPILEPFEAALKRIALGAPSIPFVSNLTGTWIRPEEATSPGYWVKHLRNTVRFSEGLETILRTPDQVLLEVGPGRTLSTLARQQPSKPLAIMTSLRHPNEDVPDVPFILGTLGRLWTAGLTPDWSGFYSGERRHRVSMPTYPFERLRHWVEAGVPKATPEPTAATDTQFQKRSDIGDWFYAPSWRRTAPAHTQADLQGDLLVFADEAGLGRDLADYVGHRHTAPQAAESRVFHLEFPTPGDSDDARLTPATRQELAPDEVEIQVKTAALNFADALNVTGIQPDAPFGMECAGVIARVGAKVTAFAPGDDVMAIGPGSFRSHVVRDARFVVRKPSELSWHEAATIPAAFMTAAYALEHVGKLAAGERILIHAASGGVGLAAVQIARQRGAEVFATAGSPEKRAYLESLGIRHVFQSRTLDFASEIASRTGGAGVDLVLNSLTGEFIRKSLGLLAPNGRFIELGKKEIYSPDQVKALAPRDGVTYHAVDLTRTLRDDPDLYGRLLEEVVDRIRRKDWLPLPHHVYPVSEAADAFRLMIQARHIGKVVLSFDADGPRTYLVEPGDRFQRLAADRFVLNPARAADYVSLFDALHDRSNDIRRIVHLWNASPSTSGERPIREQLERSFFSLLYLAQAVGRQELAQPIALTVVSTDVQQVSGESALQAGKAALLGPCRVIPREFPNITCRNVDVQFPSAAWQRERLVEQLASETGGRPQDTVVAYRGADRWVQAFEPLRLDRVHGRALRENGTYLITGGLGALGLEVAGYLADTVHARLILLARSPFPARREWTNWLAAHDGDDATSRRIRKIQEWETRGSQVFIAAADVADRDRMRSVLSEARATLGPIHGVFHLAGTLDDGLLQMKTDSSADTVLRPKVHGTLVLDELLAGEALDFLVLFSSVSSVLGLQGQVDYTAANAFLDAYAQRRTGEGATRVVSVDWSAWQEVGIAATASLGRHQTPRSGGTPGHHPWLERGHLGPAGERTFTTAFSRAKQWVIGEHVIRDSDALLPGTGYIELARAALAERPEPRAVEISNLFFQSPFVVRPDEVKELTVTLRPSGSSNELTIQSGSDTHVTAGIGYLDAETSSRIDVTAIARRCDREEATPDGFLKQDFMAFGRRWANVERVQYGSGEALITLALPAEFTADLEQIRLHPALLDMATGGAQPLIPGFEPARDFYVPFSYGRIRIYESLPARVLSHVRLREGGGQGAAFFDVTLLDERGRILVDITGFCMKRVADRQRLIQQIAAADARPRLDARAPSASGALADDILRHGIAPKEGIEALERVLNSRVAPQVVISPVNLTALMARIDRPAVASVAPAARTAADVSAPDASGKRAAPIPQGADIETRMAQIWTELLGVPSPGARDNFFDLGGHSLLAVRLLTRIEKTFHKSLPLQSLFQAATIESLSALIRGDEATSPTPTVIVPVNDHAEGPAFYCVHSLGGDVMSFRRLGKALGPDQPLYGIQAPLSGDLKDVAASIESLAERYVQELIAFQPEGPYVLGGWSAGSTIALEMAQQMLATGRTVDLLVALDGAPFNTGAGTPLWNPLYALKLLRNLPLWISDDMMVDFSIRSFGRRLWNKATSLVKSRASGLLGADRAGVEVAGFLDTSRWSHQEVEFMGLMYQALQRYVPKPYPGRVLVYQARTEPLYHLFEVDRVWRLLAPDTTVVRAGGTHLSLIYEPHVQALASDLRSRLPK